jgi:DnaJ-class molecular chaperone
MVARDPYTVLGVAKTADTAAVKKAFRAKARAAHPDSNPGDPKAEDRFKEVNKAYEILGDAEKRARFDRGEIDAEGNQTVPPFGAQTRRGKAYSGFAGGGRGFSFEDIFGDTDAFSEVFRGGGAGTRRPFQSRGANVSYTLKVGFTDAVNGATKRIALTNGKTLDVRIPPGTESGQTLRLKGQGMADAQGGAAGDALIEIEVEEHPFFKRDGHDVRLDLPITLKEAVLGAKVPVPTPFGSVALSIPKGSSSGKVLRLRGKGIPFTPPGESLERHGDLLVTLMIVVPEGDPALEAFADAWRPAGAADPRRGML